MLLSVTLSYTGLYRQGCYTKNYVPRLPRERANPTLHQVISELEHDRSYQTQHTSGSSCIRRCNSILINRSRQSDQPVRYAGLAIEERPEQGLFVMVARFFSRTNRDLRLRNIENIEQSLQISVNWARTENVREIRGGQYVNGCSCSVG